jgi:hypothetical protein
VHVPDLAGEIIRGETVLLKTFFLGIVLGLAAAAAALYAIPVVDQTREASIVKVAPNGGNSETFHINIPMDRIVLGDAGQAGAIPPGLEWPADEILTDVRAELFKIRNARDTVIGVAVRTAATSQETNVIDWVLHVPARGSLFVNMDVAPLEAGFRSGEIAAGSREFGPLSGFMTERWVANNSNAEDAPAGRIELLASYVGQLEPLKTAETVE